MQIGTQSTYYSTPLTAGEIALAKEHKIIQEANKWFRALINGEDTTGLKSAGQVFRDNAKEGDTGHSPSADWQKAIGLTIYNNDDFENWAINRSKNTGINANNIPTVPSFNLAVQNYFFDTAANKITIGIGSKIPMNGYSLEVLDNMVVARSGDGSYSQAGSASATALNSLLHGLGVDASWGYDEHTKQNVINLLDKLGVDSSKPFFINGTQFEMQGDILRTVGQTAQQEMQFWGYEGLNRLVAKAYTQNLLVSPGN